MSAVVDTLIDIDEFEQPLGVGDGVVVGTTSEIDGVMVFVIEIEGVRDMVAVSDIVGVVVTDALGVTD